MWRRDACRGAEVEVEAKASDSMRRAYEERVDLFASADALFQLFFPKAFDGPTIGQYWASVKALVAVSRRRPESRSSESRRV